MKTISVRDLQKRIRDCVEAAQHDRVVITRRGKPAAVIIGVDGLDWEQLVLGADADFWEMIEERRKSKTISMAEMRRRLAAGKRKKSSRSK